LNHRDVKCGFCRHQIGEQNQFLQFIVKQFLPPQPFRGKLFIKDFGRSRRKKATLAPACVGLVCYAKVTAPGHFP
jgi:hypothetical protein